MCAKTALVGAELPFRMCLTTALPTVDVSVPDVTVGCRCAGEVGDLGCAPRLPLESGVDVRLLAGDHHAVSVVSGPGDTGEFFRFGSNV